MNKNILALLGVMIVLVYLITREGFQPFYSSIVSRPPLRWATTGKSDAMGLTPVNPELAEEYWYAMTPLKNPTQYSTMLAQMFQQLNRGSPTPNTENVGFQNACPGDEKDMVINFVMEKIKSVSTNPDVFYPLDVKVYKGTAGSVYQVVFVLYHSWKSISTEVYAIVSKDKEGNFSLDEIQLVNNEESVNQVGFEAADPLDFIFKYNIEDKNFDKFRYTGCNK